MIEEGEEDEEGGEDKEGEKDEKETKGENVQQPLAIRDALKILVQNATREFGFAPRDVTVASLHSLTRETPSTLSCGLLRMNN